MRMIREREGEMVMIKKGPWKAEEDEVLLNHVKKHGPKDWSSIRSKGLLRRTGKSCRLRWVNKLRPDLKNGVKFSAEEERVVIELQGQYGNKWARIARYLPGRTDNDVKNFWSSRQKRLARILQTTPTSPPPPHKHKHKTREPLLPPLPFPADDLPTLEVIQFQSQECNLSCSVKEESSSKIRSCSSSSSSYVDNSEMIKRVQFTDLVNPTMLNFETQPEFYPSAKTNCLSPHMGTPVLQFPQPKQELPFFTFSQEDISFSNLSQEAATTLDNPNFLDVFGTRDGGQFPLGLPPFLALEDNYQCGVKGLDSPMTPDSFFDDFPSDMFDQIEPLPSPSNW